MSILMTARFLKGHNAADTREPEEAHSYDGDPPANGTVTIQLQNAKKDRPLFLYYLKCDRNDLHPSEDHLDRFTKNSLSKRDARTVQISHIKDGAHTSRLVKLTVVILQR